MRTEVNTLLERWQAAGLITGELAERLRAFESVQRPESGRSRIPIVVGLVFGALMLMAGVLLFVSAHWEEMSPAQKVTLLVVAVGGLHAGAAWCAEKFPATATTLHACGTIAAGGGIYLTAQVFHLEEHWPNGLLLWALCATAGWWLLRDWPQLTMMALLVPLWVMAEWGGSFAHRGAESAMMLGAWLLALTYLTAKGRQTEPLHWIGGLGLLPLTAAIATFFHGVWWKDNPVDVRMVLGWVMAVVLPLALAAWLRGSGVWMNAVAAVWILPFVIFGSREKEFFGMFAWCAVGAAGLVAWGVYEKRSTLINLGMAGFAVVLLCFYYSSVMDKLGRSASLVSMGVLFLAGGWLGEKLRRSLVAQVRTPEVLPQ